jgi:pyruvate,water dikinase
MNENNYIRWFSDLSSDDVASVGGKNASLGEMLTALKSANINVPDGFATTAAAYREFVDANDIDQKLDKELTALTKGTRKLETVGRRIRQLFRKGDMTPAFAEAIRESYRRLSRRYQVEDVDVAVRSSATAEDLPSASFAGQQETFLNVSGEDELLDTCKRCFASLFTDRAIAYREEKGFDHRKVALSVGGQKMVRSDLGSAGVMFTLDTETGFRDSVVINAAWGLGELVVQGSINPDEYQVFTPLLSNDKLTPIISKQLGAKQMKMVYAKGGSGTTKTISTSKKERRRFVLEDDTILKLARWGSEIERHYERPMDIEWAYDGEIDQLFIVQARPETVQSQTEVASLKTYKLKEKGKVIIEGLGIGQAIASGRARVIESVDKSGDFEKGDILVTGMTDPDWGPLMKQAAAIVTDQGGRTSHAAIVSRELGIPAVIGCGEATDEIEDGRDVTVSCVEGDNGYVYEGILDFEAREINLADLPDTTTSIKMNIASPAAAFRWWQLPCRGIGLARMEFIINNIIRIHPLALLHFDKVEDDEDKKTIKRLTRGFKDKTDFFVEHLARGIAKIAASQHPDEVIVRMSDFKSNEYADLIGGRGFEPDEENPMIGFRGASRYYSDHYRDAFALECRAVRMAREEIGLDNIAIMIPFCRTLDEADRVLSVLADNGLQRGRGGLRVFLMCEIPANVVLASEFARRFDGFSIGSNDLTQLALGVDRDSEELSALFDERDPTVQRMVAQAITAAHDGGIEIGICGQAPSDYPEFAEFLVRQSIDSISLNPDSVVEVIEHVAQMEAKMSQERSRAEVESS